MSVAREDYIQRQIGLLAEAVRRLRGMLGGGASPEIVIAEIRAAEAELLGTKAPVVRVLDSATAARLLNSPEAVRLWSELLRLEADAYRQAGSATRAEAIDTRAAELSRAADGG